MSFTAATSEPCPGSVTAGLPPLVLPVSLIPLLFLSRWLGLAGEDLLVADGGRAEEHVHTDRHGLGPHGRRWAARWSDRGPYMRVPARAGFLVEGHRLVEEGAIRN